MTRLGTWFLWSAVAAAALYLVTFASVVASRVRYDRRRWLLERVERALESRGMGLDATARRARALAVLSAARLREVERIAAETPLARPVEEVFCQYLLEALGPDRVRERAGAHRGERARWARIAALRVLTLARPEEAWSALERALLDRDPDVVAASVVMLGNASDPKAAELLVRALRVGRFPPSRIATFLDRFPSDLSGLLRPLLERPNASLRYWGALLIGRYPSTPGLEIELAALARDEEPAVRKAAVVTLARHRSASAREVARRLLADPVAFVRAHAARALGELGSIEDAGDVVALLADRDWWVRHAAKATLVRMGPLVLPILEPYLAHEDTFARNGAAEVLQNLGIFESLLTAEAEGPPQAERSRILAALARAGGVRMSEVAFSRLTPEARGRASAILRQVGVERAAARAATAV